MRNKDMNGAGNEGTDKTTAAIYMFEWAQCQRDPFSRAVSDAIQASAGLQAILSGNPLPSSEVLQAGTP
jgi:hypothetical protein